MRCFITKKAFKLLTTALLLAVSFNNSYSMNNNITSMDDIIELLSQGNLTNKDIKIIEKSFYNVIEPMVNMIEENFINNCKMSPSCYEIADYVHFSPNLLELDVNVQVRQDVKNFNTVKKLGNIISESGMLTDDYNDEFIKQIIQQMKTKLMADYFMCKIAQKDDVACHMCITFNFYDKINGKCIDRILNNIKENKNFDTNVREFFDKYLRNGYKPMAKIFATENQQILNNIKLILE